MDAWLLRDYEMPASEVSETKEFGESRKTGSRFSWRQSEWWSVLYLVLLHLYLEDDLVLYLEMVSTPGCVYWLWNQGDISTVVEQ